MAKEDPRKLAQEAAKSALEAVRASLAAISIAVEDTGELVSISAGDEAVCGIRSTLISCAGSLAAAAGE